MKIKLKLIILMLVVSVGAIIVLSLGMRHISLNQEAENEQCIKECVDTIGSDVYSESQHVQSLIAEIKVEKMRTLIEEAFERTNIYTKNLRNHVEECYDENGTIDEDKFKDVCREMAQAAEDNELIKYVEYGDSDDFYEVIYSDKKDNVDWLPLTYFFYLSEDEESDSRAIRWGLSENSEGHQSFMAEIDTYWDGEYKGYCIIVFSTDKIMNKVEQYVDLDVVIDGAEVSEEKYNDNIFILDTYSTVYAQTFDPNSDLSKLSEEKFERLQQYARTEADNYELWSHREYGATTFYSDDEDEFYLAIVPVDYVDWLICAYIPADRFEKSYNKVEDNMQEAYRNLETIRNTTVRNGLQFEIFFIAIIVLVVVIVSTVFASRFTRPILKLESGVKKMQEGDLDAKVDISSKDEIGSLTNEFNDMADKLKTYLENITEMTVAKERVQAEMNMAARVQMSMLPETDLICERAMIKGTMRPAKSVGGDFYDFFRLDEDHLVFFIADVSDKGMPAAMFMSIGKTLLRELNVTEMDAEKAFRDANNMLCRNNKQMQFITAFEGVLDLRTGELVFVNAGHEKPVLYKSSEKKAVLYEIEGSFPLAVFEDVKYEKGVIQLEPGDCLLQYTDGATEAINEAREMYGEGRLVEAFEKCVMMDNVFEGLFDTMHDFTKDMPPFDDTAYVLIQYIGNEKREG